MPILGTLELIEYEFEDADKNEITLKKEFFERLVRNTNRLERLASSKIVTVVVDQATSVAIEINDDTKKTFEEASGPAIYSNSELTVSSCMSIFETLWIQSEFDKQNKIKQAYFQTYAHFNRCCILPSQDRYPQQLPHLS